MEGKKKKIKYTESLTNTRMSYNYIHLLAHNHRTSKTNLNDDAEFSTLTGFVQYSVTMMHGMIIIKALTQIPFTTDELLISPMFLLISYPTVQLAVWCIIRYLMYINATAYLIPP